MKNSGENGSQAALCLQHEAFEIPDDKEIIISRTPEQTTQHPVKKNNIIGLSGDVRHHLLKLENKRLKALVEDLILDKSCQARRIMELNRETSRLKKAIADLIIGNENK
jgi:hypothetical protein